MSKSLGIGIVGAGTVGGGVVEIIRDKCKSLETKAGIKPVLIKVADLDKERLKKLGLNEEVITDNAEEVINNPEINVVVELIGGTGIAYDIVEKALKAGKNVVTANKALLSERGGPLFKLAKEKNCALAFEAAVAGAIPIIKAVRDGLVADDIECLLGIVNGTCNYILTQMINSGQDYSSALADAQKLGFAEADPTFDVEGNDSAHKLTLLSQLGFDTSPEYSKLNIQGISNLSLDDVTMAAEMGYTVKLLAVARPVGDKLFLSVHPALLKNDHPLASVMGSMNAVSLIGDNVEEAMFYGRGAGKMPTASAVVSDIIEIGRSIVSGANQVKWLPQENNKYIIGEINDYMCRYFVRLTVQDQFGVLGKIATILGENEVSIASVVQKEMAQGAVPIVVLTQSAREGNLINALQQIEDLDFVIEKPGILRVEE